MSQIELMKKEKNNMHATKLGEISVAESIEQVVEQLNPPRVVWLMLPAGEATESVLQEVAKYVEPEDVVIDGGNAYYKDTQRRYETFAINKVRFLGIGVSGGIHAFDRGYPMMVGGDISAYQEVSTILDSLAKPHARHHFFGEGGAGHFVKMVHNGIEYGMMQAIGEGFGVLDAAPYEFDLFEVARVWQRGTIISGFLMDCTVNILKNISILESIKGSIEASGEGQWTVQQGKIEDVPVENIEQALLFRQRSQTDKEIQDSFAAKLVAALRREFGGHKVEKK
jgi:6-phosphogluconate dehydrogenase